MKSTMVRKNTKVMIVGIMCRRLVWKDTMGSKVTIVKKSSYRVFWNGKRMKMQAYRNVKCTLVH